MLFQHTALSVFAERMRLNQMRDFPNVVHLERKRHVTWSQLQLLTRAALFQKSLRRL
jgi:hypothetical protein